MANKKNFNRIVGVGIMAIAFAVVFPESAYSQSFLDKVKNKAKEKISDGVGKVKKGIKIGENQSSNNNGVGRTVGNGQSNNAASGSTYKNEEVTDLWSLMTAPPDEDYVTIPPSCNGLHMGTSHSAYRRSRRYGAQVPKTTASTVHIVLDDDMPHFSDFYDGVAYVYSYQDKRAFYINTKGEVLFDTEVRESDDKLMPRFDNGAVLEESKAGLGGGGSVVLRDKKGNIIKEFKNSQATHIVDGVAIVFTKVAGASFSKYTMKYIDAKGNDIFPGLKVNNVDIPYGADLKALNRKASEGLIAYPSFVNGNWRWGFRDASGKVIIQPKYIAVNNFHDGMACFVSDSGKFGFIDKTGKEVIAPAFSILPSDFDSGYARVVTRNDDAYIIDKKGNKVKGPFNSHGDNEGDLTYISPFFNGYAIMGEFTKENDSSSSTYCKTVYYVVDSNFRKHAWVDNEFSTLYLSTPISYDNGRLYIDNSGSWGLCTVNPANLDQLVPDLEKPFVNGYSRIYRNGMGYLNSNFEFVIKFEKNEF